MAEKFSGARWRQIEAGFRKDIGREVIAKPATLAHMASAVGVSPERLAEAGRNDAAKILREIQRQRGDESASHPYANLADPEERTIWNWPVPEATRRKLIDVLREGRGETRQAG